MSQIIVDPDEQRAFAKDLDLLVGELRDRQRRLEGSIQQLGGVWKDKRYRAFNRAVTEASLQLTAFYSASDRYSHFLRRKARAADVFLRRP